jgi:hypothetical protein
MSVIARDTPSGTVVYTDYPFTELGDAPDMEAPIKKVVFLLKAYNKGVEDCRKRLMEVNLGFVGEALITQGLADTFTPLKK